MKNIVFVLVMGLTTFISLTIISCKKDVMEKSPEQVNFKFKSISMDLKLEDENDIYSQEWMEYTISGEVSSDKKIGINKIISGEGVVLHTTRDVEYLVYQYPAYRIDVIVNGINLKPDEVWFTEKGVPLNVEWVIKVYRPATKPRDIFVYQVELKNLTYLVGQNEIRSLSFDDKDYISDRTLY